MLTYNFYIIIISISYSRCIWTDISNIHHYKNFIRTIAKVNCSNKMQFYTNKNKRIIKKNYHRHLDQFYLLISLEVVWSILERIVLIIRRHLHNM